MRAFISIMDERELLQENGTMARSSQTSEEYTLTYTDENGNEATALI